MREWSEMMLFPSQPQQINNTQGYTTCELCFGTAVPTTHKIPKVLFTEKYAAYSHSGVVCGVAGKQTKKVVQIDIS